MKALLVIAVLATIAPTPTGYSVPMRTTLVPHAHQVTAPLVGPPEPTSALEEFLALCEKHGGTCQDRSIVYPLNKPIPALNNSYDLYDSLEMYCCRAPALRYREGAK